MHSSQINQIQISAILDAATKISLIAKYIYLLETQHFDSRCVFNPAVGVIRVSQFEELLLLPIALRPFQFALGFPYN